MSSSSDNLPPSASASSARESSETNAPFTHWRVALMDLLAARLSLIQLESQDAARETTRRVALIAVASAATFFAWALLLAGGVSLLSQSTGWPWNLIAIGFAAIHLVIGIILSQSAKPSGNPSFPVTRAEFQKDREWIENFNRNKKSND
jgi:Putative Actinobacterial Holin-X, holin superfamily III